MIRKTIKSILVLSIAIAQLHCARAKFQRLPADRGTATETVSQSGARNNGGGYPGVIFSERQAASCAGQATNVRTAIGYIERQQQFWLVRQDCQDISPRLLTAEQVAFVNGGKSAITYDGLVLQEDQRADDGVDWLREVLDWLDEI